MQSNQNIIRAASATNILHNLVLAEVIQTYWAIVMIQANAGRDNHSVKKKTLHCVVLDFHAFLRVSSVLRKR